MLHPEVINGYYVAVFNDCIVYTAQSFRELLQWIAENRANWT